MWPIRQALGRGIFCALAVSLGLALPSNAQQQGPTLPNISVQSPVLTVDSERLFNESAFGRRVAREIEAVGQTIQADNERIASELEREEQELTERRPTLEPEEFKELADAFNDKAERIRRERSDVADALSLRLQREQQAFVQAIVPVMEEIMRAAGAGVVLERGSVFISARAIDVTDIAIQRIDQTLGEGQATER